MKINIWYYFILVGLIFANCNESPFDRDIETELENELCPSSSSSSKNLINYPLEIGTKWIYYSYNKVSPPDGSYNIYRYYKFYEVLGDTIIGDNNFKKIKLRSFNIDSESKSELLYHLRLDNNCQIIYKYDSTIEKENLLYPLYLDQDETLLYEIWGKLNYKYEYTFECIEVSDTNLFGLLFPIKKFRNYDEGRWSNSKLEIVDKIGLTYESNSHDAGSYSNNLKYFSSNELFIGDSILLNYFE